MNYKLAKQLKDAGFPIKEFIYDEKNYVINITLSKLIEACGEDFAELERPTEEQEWFASVKTNEEKDICKKCGTRTVAPICEYGKTPEEAIAKLWLKLNKNK